MNKRYWQIPQVKSLNIKSATKQIGTPSDPEKFNSPTEAEGNLINGTLS